MQKGRWLVIFLCFLAVAINYIDRANLAVAAPYIQKELGLGSGQMGLLLSGFFWTYALMQMPFGWFVDKVGARIALPLAVAWWSLFTAATAAASSLASMFGCRLMLGVGEAGARKSSASGSTSKSAALPPASSTAARGSARRCPFRWWR